MSSLKPELSDLLPIDPAELERLCREYGIVELAVFGSVARGELDESSDVDLLYVVDPEVELGWEIEALNEQLSAAVGRPVDLVSKKYLHAKLRDQILSEAVTVYAA
jgi:predicted nucleotidyltransferase